MRAPAARPDAFSEPNGPDDVVIVGVDPGLRNTGYGVLHCSPATTEVLDFNGEHVEIRDIFVFKQTGVDEDGKVLGSLMPTGRVPSCLEHLTSSGEDVDQAIFAPPRPALVGGDE